MCLPTREIGISGRRFGAEVMSPSIIHLTAIAGRSGTGISSVVWGLSRAQLSRGEHVEIWCCDGNAAFEAARDCGVTSDVVKPFPTLGPRRHRFSPRMWRTATRRRDASQVLHQHGIWTAISVVANASRRRGHPTVLAPHGGLNPWGLNQSPIKRALRLRISEGKNLRETECLHATSAEEIKDFRNFGLKGPIALIPNGVSKDWLGSEGNAERFRREFSMPEGKRIMFFLSRITPQKGLPVLLEAWAAHRRVLQDWRLIIAGTDELSHRKALVNQVAALSLGDSVIFLGPLYGADKRDAFAASDAFVLPSHGEGSPMAILDALGAGVPVLTTHRAPWEDLERHRCGWWTPNDAGGIGEALVDISRRSHEELVSFGARGKALVSTNYSWESAADKCARLYRWLLKLDPIPDFVLTD